MSLIQHEKINELLCQGYKIIPPGRSQLTGPVRLQSPHDSIYAVAVDGTVSEETAIILPHDLDHK